MTHPPPGAVVGSSGLRSTEWDLVRTYLQRRGYSHPLFPSGGASLGARQLRLYVSETRTSVGIVPVAGGPVGKGKVGITASLLGLELIQPNTERTERVSAHGSSRFTPGWCRRIVSKHVARAVSS